jgi:hypothetical protein
MHSASLLGGPPHASQIKPWERLQADTCRPLARTCYVLATGCVTSRAVSLGVGWWGGLREQVCTEQEAVLLTRPRQAHVCCVCRRTCVRLPITCACKWRCKPGPPSPPALASLRLARHHIGLAARLAGHHVTTRHGAPCLVCMLLPSAGVAGGGFACSLAQCAAMHCTALAMVSSRCQVYCQRVYHYRPGSPSEPCRRVKDLPGAGGLCKLRRRWPTAAFVVVQQFAYLCAPLLSKARYAGALGICNAPVTCSLEVLYMLLELRWKEAPWGVHDACSTLLCAPGLRRYIASASTWITGMSTCCLHYGRMPLLTSMLA